MIVGVDDEASASERDEMMIAIWAPTRGSCLSSVHGRPPLEALFTAYEMNGTKTFISYCCRCCKSARHWLTTAP